MAGALTFLDRFNLEDLKMTSYKNYAQEIEYICPWTKENLKLKCDYNNYVHGGIALRLLNNVDGYLEPYLVASICVPGLKANEIAIKNYSENIGVLDELLKNDVIYPHHRYVQSGFILVPICHLKEVT